MGQFEKVFVRGWRIRPDGFCRDVCDPRVPAPALPSFQATLRQLTGHPAHACKIMYGVPGKAWLIL
jgi:hypothetical protein